MTAESMRGASWQARVRWTSRIIESPDCACRNLPRYNARPLCVPSVGADVIAIVLSLLLAAHLLCVNVAAGGPLVAAWLDWRGVRGDEAAGRAARWLAR